RVSGHCAPRGRTRRPGGGGRPEASPRHQVLLILLVLTWAVSWRPARSRAARAAGTGGRRRELSPGGRDSRRRRKMAPATRARPLGVGGEPGARLPREAQGCYLSDVRRDNACIDATLAVPIAKLAAVCRTEREYYHGPLVGAPIVPIRARPGLCIFVVG